MTDATNPLGEHLYALVDRLREADGLLVLLDFDGSLAPIVEDPDAAALPDETREAVVDLRDAPNVQVGIVSGRQLADLRERVDVDGVAYAGNHGLELWADGEEQVNPTARELREDVDAVVETVESELADVDGAFVEDKGVTATVHYRRASEDAVPDVKDAVREAAVDVDDVRVTAGKSILELRPDVDWDKGRATDWLSDRFVPDDEEWLSLYLGDDRTDEDAFDVLTDADSPGMGIKVGHEPPTVAEYRVDGPVAVHATLRWLVDYGLSFLDAEPGEHPRSSRPTE
ncbi:trehalose-phosphatase [Halomicrococcus sp. NG-SE-24]|uniref:trehalose-phosphatase n=1 Tax=Halomicrococcus sp. NG-SE-24 TaxID=3436928 RepID=UPI003D9609EC